jgi:hypothetical protein
MFVEGAVVALLSAEDGNCAKAVPHTAIVTAAAKAINKIIVVGE